MIVLLFISYIFDLASVSVMVLFANRSLLVFVFDFLFLIHIACILETLDRSDVNHFLRLETPKGLATGFLRPAIFDAVDEHGSEELRLLVKVKTFPAGNFLQIFLQQDFFFPIEVLPMDGHIDCFSGNIESSMLPNVSDDSFEDA